jgi:5'-nucleotidase
MHKPLRTNPASYFGSDIRAWAVNGTPSDCVKLGIEALLKEKPDMVFSGINNGPNLGTDVLYSGTVSAAVESVLLGVPAAALSLASYDCEDYSFASGFAVSLAQNIYKEGLDGDTLLNVNIPCVARDKINGVGITKLGLRKYRNSFESRRDPRGQQYYWMSGEAVNENEDSDCDINLVAKNYIAITPIHIELTRFDYMDRLKRWRF